MLPAPTRLAIYGASSGLARWSGEGSISWIPTATFRPRRTMAPPVSKVPIRRSVPPSSPEAQTTASPQRRLLGLMLPSDSRAPTASALEREKRFARRSQAPSSSARGARAAARSDTRQVPSSAARRMSCRQRKLSGSAQPSPDPPPAPPPTPAPETPAPAARRRCAPAGPRTAGLLASLPDDPEHRRPVLAARLRDLGLGPRQPCV